MSVKRIDVGAKTGHPETGELLDQLEGRLALDRLREVATHVLACRRCQRSIEELKRVTNSLGASTLESPPEWLANWADDRPRDQPKKVPKGLMPILRLVLDSWRLEPLGARGVAPSSRRLLYRAGSVDLDIELDLGRAGRTATVRGQILDATVTGGRQFSEGHVRLLAGRRLVVKVPLGTRGDFRLSDVPRRVYHLNIAAAGFRVRVDSFEI